MGNADNLIRRGKRRWAGREDEEGDKRKSRRPLSAGGRLSCAGLELILDVFENISRAFDEARKELIGHIAFEETKSLG